MTIAENLRLLSNSPTHERDMASMFNALRLGAWFFVLHTVLLLAIGSTFSMLSQYSINPRFDRGVYGSIDLSEILTSVIFLSLASFLTIFVPIRVIGPVMGPRTGRYFDQIVLSGISPVRYFVGKVMSQNVFLAVIAFAALPYIVLCIAMGGISVTYTLLGICVLAVYTNVLALSTLVLSIFFTEIASIAIVLCLSVLAFAAGFLTNVPNLAPLSPSAVFMAPLYEGFVRNAGDVHSASIQWNIVGQPLTLLQIQLIIFFISAAAIAVVSASLILLGPINCIIQENGTFGEVVLKGDRRKRGFFRMRKLLQLRSEISFFYENRAPWLKRWDFLWRWSITEFLFLVGLAMPFLFLSRLGEFNEAQIIIFAFLLGLIWILLNNVLFLRDRSVERLRYSGIEAGQIDLIFYFANLVMIAAAVSIFLVSAEDLLDQTWFNAYLWQNSNAVAQLRPPVWNLPWAAVAATVLILGFELHWLARWISTRMWSKMAALFTAAFVFLGTSLLPLSPFMSLRVAVSTRAFAEVEPFLSVVANLSPTIAVFHAIKRYSFTSIGELGTAGFHLMLGFHLCIGLVWMLVFFRARGKLPVRELT